MRAFQHIQHTLNGAGYRVFGREAVALEKGVKDGPRDDVLGQHLDGLGFRNTAVQVIANFGKEAVEFRACRAGR